MKNRGHPFLLMAILIIASLTLVAASAVAEVQASNNHSATTFSVDATLRGGDNGVIWYNNAPLNTRANVDATANSNVTGTYNERASINFPDVAYLQKGAVYINLGKTLANSNTNEGTCNKARVAKSLQNQASGENKTVSGDILAAPMCQIPATCDMPASNSS